MVYLSFARRSKSLPFLSSQTIKRLIRQYGTESQLIFAGCQTSKDLGQNFGNEIFQCELDWAIANEWVSCADDFLWRRSKLGLRVDSKEKSKIEHYILNITR